METVQQERKIVSILFSDLSDSTGISASLEPEQFAEMLSHIRSMIEHVISAHSGEVIRIDGDGVLAIFGYPISFENSARRATEAAIDLLANMATLDETFAPPDHPLRLHMGIHSGMVLVRTGDMVRGKYEILGDATNVSARLCDAALPGEILVSSQSLGSERHFFKSGDARNVTLSGRTSTIEALPIIGRADVPHSFSARTKQGLTPYQGRADEKKAFLDWLNAGANCPKVLLIHGPAGIGKSRFVRVMAEEAIALGWTVARGFCEAYLSAPPFQPFLQIARKLSQSDLSVVPHNAQALGELLIKHVDQSNTLLIIDDWQWADDASRDMLAALLDRCGDNLKIMLASRENIAGLSLERNIAALTLPPLDRDEMLCAIETLLRAADPFVVGRIEQASGGSPLLIEELCHAFALGTPQPDRDPRGTWFDLAVQARFACLEPDAQQLLILASAIGPVVPAWLLEVLAGPKMNEAVLDHLQAADFLFLGDSYDTYRFKHGLTRDAVYTSIGRNQRLKLHSQILDVLEMEASRIGEASLLDALAYQSVAAGLNEPALRYALAAGDAAMKAGALDRAQAHYAASIPLAEALPSSAQRSKTIRSILNRYGIACIVDPAEDQLPLLNRTRERLLKEEDAAGAIRGSYWLGSVTYGVGRGRESVKILESALADAQMIDRPELAMQVRTKLAQSLSASGQYVEANAHFENVLPLLRSRKDGVDWEVLAYALCCYGFLLADQGQFAKAASLYDEAQNVVNGRVSPVMASILTQKVAVALWLGRWEDALHIADQSLEGSTRSRQRFQTVISLALKAYARWQLFADTGAIEVLESSAQWFLTKGNSQQRSSLVFGWLVDVMAHIGDKAKAREYAIPIVQRIRRGGDRLGEAMAWRALARLEQGEGHSEQADHYMDLADRSAALRQSRREVAQNSLAVAQLWLARGEPARAADHLSFAEAEFKTMGMSHFAGRAAALTIR